MPDVLAPIIAVPRITLGGLNADLNLEGLLGRVSVGLKLRIGGKDTPPPPPPPANDPPVAQSDTAEVRENGSLSVSANDGVILSAQRVGSRDTDPNGDALVVRSVKNSAGVEAAAGAALKGTYGTLTLNADGSYSYQPNDAAKALKNGERDIDTFTYTIADTKGATASTTLTIGISGVTDGPPKLEIPGESPGQPDGFAREVIDTISGSFKFASPDGFGSLSIHDRTITADELSAVKAGGTLEVTTSLGKLTVTSLTGDFASGGEVTVGYSYKAGPVMHDATLEATDSIQIKLVDRVGGQTATSLDIIVQDTQPTGDFNVRTMTEREASTGGTLRPSITGDAASHVPNHIDGKYGTFDINEQGEWVYKLDTNNATVRGLNDGQSIFEVFNTPVQDSDGSVVFSRVVVNINGVTGEAPQTTATPASSAVVAEERSNALAAHDVMSGDQGIPGLGPAGAHDGGSHMVTWQDTGFTFANHGAELMRMAETATV